MAKKFQLEESKPKESKLAKRKFFVLPHANEPAKFNHKDQRWEWLKK